MLPLNKNESASPDPLKWLLNFLDWFQNHLEVEGEKRSEIYDTVSGAYFETLSVLTKSLDHDSEIPSDKRDHLSKLWQKAAKSVREYDADAFHTFFEKSKYWQDPKSWSTKEIKNSGISLEDIEKIVRKFGLF